MSNTAITAHAAGQSLVVRPTREVAQIADAVEAARKAGYNVLAPSTWLEQVPADHQLAVRVVRPRDGSFWPTGGGKHAPRGEFILELSRAAGVIWRTDLVRRTDDRSDPYVCEFEATCLAPDPTTGRPTPYKGTYQLDLREGSATSEDVIASARSTDKGEAQLRQKRRFIVQLCETGAMLRAARKAIGVRGDYSAAEIQKPFFLVSLEYLPTGESAERMSREAVERIYYGGLASLGRQEPEPVEAEIVGRGEYRPPELPLDDEDLVEVTAEAPSEQADPSERWAADGPPPSDADEPRF